MDNEFSTSDVVSAIMTGDNNRARESVLGLLSKRSMDELEVRKAEIAQTLFKDAPVDDEQPEQEMQVVDPANGQPTGEVVNQMSDQEPEIQEPVQPDNVIQVMDPVTGQPTGEVLNAPQSVSA